ncbi:hypothetical protein JTE90_005135 [Oedothorax gibbosus]|uniref:Uncharacterized protein n=1 Tax=Oedothorax gibbosus TaxID=931172 RepID=A0AAV6UNF9_9ARAC|nr:hypothetical protein JTE90_005135 [Oedothorax gibbosus]
MSPSKLSLLCCVFLFAILSTHLQPSEALKSIKLKKLLKKILILKALSPKKSVAILPLPIPLELLKKELAKLLGGDKEMPMMHMSPMSMSPMSMMQMAPMPMMPSYSEIYMPSGHTKIMPHEMMKPREPIMMPHQEMMKPKDTMMMPQFANYEMMHTS